MIRPGQLEHDALADLHPGARNLSWSAMLEYYKKVRWRSHDLADRDQTENFHAPTAEYASRAGGIPINATSHAQGGPIDVSYPAYQYSQAALFNPTMNALGHPTVDPNGAARSFGD